MERPGVSGCGLARTGMARQAWIVAVRNGQPSYGPVRHGNAGKESCVKSSRGRIRRDTAGVEWNDSSRCEVATHGRRKERSSTA